MKQTFEEKVKSMSAKEIILAMVHGLEKQHVAVNMGSYGFVEDGICFGCAATNAICEISGKTFNKNNIHRRVLRARFINAEGNFLYEFERAIEYLRRGLIAPYNCVAEEYGFAQIKDVDFPLPYLTTSKWKERLHHYKTLAEKQD